MNISDFYQRKIFPNLQYYYTKANAIRYKKYALKHFPLSSSDSPQKRYHKIMNIEQGEFSYEYFNFCYMHNMISLMIYSLYHHCIPRITINENNQDLIQWDWYFQIPIDQTNNVPDLPVISCSPKTNSFQPHFSDIYDPVMVDLWSNIYRSLVKYNSTTAQYIEAEYQELFSAYPRVLGVICRGTDYTSLKPSGHPVQPPVEEIINFCKEHMNSSKYDAIYLATEEQQIRDAFLSAFSVKILENKRKYYDDIYYSNPQIQYIKDVHFDRSNNNYWMGLEYLSSITLLSRCTSLIGGNCGGTMGAIFMNGSQYEYTHIFNQGLYP